jgi:hypothetical protein
LKKFKMAAVAMVTKVQNGHQIQKSSDLGKIWFPSRLWCCELIFIVGLLWCSELGETFQKFCLTCVHIILRLRNFRMAVIATKKREKVLGIGWNLIEMLYDMCINGFEAWKFQNARRCHGNHKNTQFNTKVNNNHIFSDIVCK